MLSRRFLALAGAVCALVLTSGTAALAAGTSVTVRVEGLKRTLLAPKVVHTHAGSITKRGAPPHSCPATSAAGALDVATHHNWNGTYSSGLGIEVTKILGERHVFSVHGFYWGIWVDNKFAQFGICDLKLHRGEQILLAPAPGSGNTYPTAIRAPHSATAGHPVKLEVVYYNNAGKPRPLAGATVKGAGVSRVTNQQGDVTVTPGHSGRDTFTATKKGYIRPVAVTVHVA